MTSHNPAMDHPTGTKGRAGSLLRALVVLVLLVKLAQIAFAGVIVDEAYYWLWAQHPDWSYYDHPPMVGWIIMAFERLGLPAFWALRLPVVLTLIGDLWVILAFSRLPGARREQEFWSTALLFLITPVFWIMTSVAFPDHLMVFFGLVALYGFTRFALDLPDARPWLYAGAGALGLATLSKFNAALIGLGFAAAILLTPAWWRHLRNPHLYIAALISIVCLAPVFWWNIANGNAAFDFILYSRHHGVSGPLTIAGLPGFGFLTLVTTSPFFVFAALAWMVTVLRHPLRAEIDNNRVGFFVFVASTLAIGALALRSNVHFHWNLVAWLGFLPVLAVWLRHPVLRVGHILYGAVIALALVINFTLAPVTMLTGPVDRVTAWAYGWDDIAAAVERLREEKEADFVAGSHYGTTARLALALGDADVRNLENRQSQFDFWFDRQAAAGQSAIIRTDPYNPMSGYIRAQFETVTELETVQVSITGREILTHTLWLGEGFRP